MAKEKPDDAMFADFTIVKIKKETTTTEILEEYDVGMCHVTITSDGLYNIGQPEITERAELMIKYAMDRVFESMKGDNPELKMANIANVLDDVAQTEEDFDVLHAERESILYYIGIEIVGFMEVDTLMQDPNIEDIICTRWDRSVAVIHRNHSDLVTLLTNITFGTEERLNAWIQRVSSRYGNPPTYAYPIQDYSTEKQDRITIVGQDRVSKEGGSFAIRKFPAKPYVITHLLESKVLTIEMAAYLWMLIDATPFLLIIGETGSGKTTLINALMCLSDPRLHVMVIEDTRELQLPHYLVEYTVTSAESVVNNPITLIKLVRLSLRKKPHFVLIGECRNEETREMFQGAATGHGAMTSFHAAGMNEAISRLSSDPININVNQMLNLWGMIHVSKIRNNDGEIVRRVIDYDEITYPDRKIETCNVFHYDYDTDKVGPDDYREIMAKSVKLEYAATRAGVAKADIESDLQRRQELLKECISKKAYDIKDVFEITSKLYRR